MLLPADVNAIVEAVIPLVDQMIAEEHNRQRKEALRARAANLKPLTYQRSRPGNVSPNVPMEKRVLYAKEAGNRVARLRRQGIKSASFDRALADVYREHGAVMSYHMPAMYSRAKSDLGAKPLKPHRVDPAKLLPWGSSPNKGDGPNPGAAPGTLPNDVRADLAKKARVRVYESREKGVTLDYYKILEEIYKEAGMSEYFARLKIRKGS